jgi:hypothetical protein
MREKNILIGVFVKRDRILSFMEFLKNEFNIKYKKIYVHKIKGNEIEYLATFPTFNRDYLKKINNSILLHVKNGCLFSINALNKLIESNSSNKDIDNKNIIIDWNKYKNNLIILSNNVLNIKNLSKIEDKTSFFID